MKRDEKNLRSRQKILDSAFAEFGERGYGLSSINTICTAGDISKGILYHYFKDKDALYLACVAELLDSLRAYLTQALRDASGTKAARLTRYFDARLRFFEDHPRYRKLFCDVVIAPPQHLAAEIGTLRAGLDALNISVLTGLLEELELRNGVTVAAAVKTFGLYQDFVNARFQMEAGGKIDLEQHEETCKRSLDILLYGIVKREEI